MSLLCASVRAPVSLHSEAASSSAGVQGASSKAAPRATFFRKNGSLDSLKKVSVQQKVEKGFRLQVSARNGDNAIRSVPVQVAHELCNAGHRYLDVRTVEEYNAGHVEGSVNIPYLLKCGPGMSKNHKFLEQVEATFGKDDEIIVGCKSGKRSMMAAAELISAEFTGITDLGGGYMAWEQSGLPTVSAKRASV